MVWYRPHRGSLSDAMREAKQFLSVDEMKNAICRDFMEQYGFPLVDACDITLSEPIGDDERVGWKNVQYVLTRRFGSEEYDVPQAIGMCSVDCEDQSILEPAARERIIMLLRQLDATQLDAVYGFIIGMMRSDAAIDAKMRCASPEVDKWFDK